MDTTVEISSAILLRLLRTVGTASPNRQPGACPDHEWCGILRGRRGEGRERVIRADPADNVAAEPSRCFEIDPAALLRAHRGARRAGGLALLGYYHTHPRGPATPSLRDAESAAPDGRLWVIGARDGVLVWRAVRDGAMHGRFDPVRFDLRVGTRVERNCPGLTWRRPPSGAGGGMQWEGEPA